MEDQMNLEEMRSQFATLKKQLDKQEIVSDRLIRETMKYKTGNISTAKRVTYGATLFCLVAYPLSYFAQIWSLPFTVATCAMILFCAAATYYIHRPVEELNFMRDDFATVARVMARFKEQYDNWLHYATPAILIPWVAWVCYEYAWKRAPVGISPWLLCMPMLIAVAIGGLIGYRFHRKAVNAAQDILNQIEND